MTDDDPTDAISQRIDEGDEIRSGHELYNDDVSLTITLDNLNEPQAIALIAMLENWETHSKWGSSRWVSFYVDGDGPFHPQIDIDVDGEVLQSSELKEIAELQTNKFDFDPVTGWFIDRALEVDE